MSRKSNKMSVVSIVWKINGFRPQGNRQWRDLQKVQVLFYINIESQQPKFPYALQMMMMTILPFTQIFGMDQPAMWAAVQGWTVIRDQTAMDVVANMVV